MALRERLLPGVAALAAFGLMLALWHAASTPYFNYVLLANAWLHGRVWIDFPGPFIDAVRYNGHYHVVEAPMPALLLAPFVALFGDHANQTLLANGVGAGCVFTAWRLCQRLKLPNKATLAAVVFLFFGTSLFVSSTEGDVWLLAHICGMLFSLLALCEVYGRGRPWLVALLSMGAMLSRYSLIVAIPFYLALLLIRKPRLEVGAWFAATIVPIAAFVGLYNYANWGDPWASGYAIWYRIMDPRFENDPSMFSWANFSSQMSLYVRTPPQLIGVAPWVIPPKFGFGFLFTSLPFLYGFAARWCKDAALLVLATLATAVPALFYYDQGGVQFGVRHALDFEPFLFVLLALALKYRPSNVVIALLWGFSAFGFYEGLVWLLWPGIR